MNFKVFEFSRATRGKLVEYGNNSKWWFEYSENGKTYIIDLYNVAADDEKTDRLYLGYTEQEVLSSGKDILAQKLFEKGEFSYSDVKGILNPVTQNAYCFLGGVASHAGITVDTMGVAYPQLSGRDREPRLQFTPLWFDETLGSIKPIQHMLGGEYPILCSRHTDGKTVLEFLYFVEPGDPDRDPVLWIRAKKYDVIKPEDFKLNYFTASFAREAFEEDTAFYNIKEDIYLEAMVDTFAHWIKFSEKTTKLSLPDEEIARVSRGALAFSAITFTADKPHYGHKYYGKELHDNFPPNYIWAIEAAILYGHKSWAKRIFEYLINYGTNDCGRFNYRQGTALVHGASATEYGMILHLCERYKKELGLISIDEETESKLCMMGDIILSNCLICPEFDNKILVKMCAEADNNSRINVYLNNNLWSIRGLLSLAKLLDKHGKIDGKKYSDMAKTLKKNINYMIEKHTERNTRFGDLPPFRFGYPATPLTLSNCDETFYEITKEERDKYFAPTVKDRTKDATGQELTENTYANYRYYPEALSSMILDEKYCDSIVNMRENLGGELLGMTRLRSWVDNWPVLNYARFLIESGRIEKYLMLLYAHTAHHGHPHLVCYYEQFKLHGEYRMPDCVPSLLTTPTMVAWMFAYEKMEGNLMLLGALPKKWYSMEFSAENLGYPGGTMNVQSTGKKITFEFSAPIPEGTKLVWRTKESVSVDDILCGKEFVEEINGNIITLKKGIQTAEFTIK